MGLHVLYGAISLLGFVAQFGLLVILLVRRQYKTFPVFTLYLASNFLTDVGTIALLVPVPTACCAHVVFSDASITVPARVGCPFRDSVECSFVPCFRRSPRGTIRVFVKLVALAVLCGTLLAWHFEDTGNKVNDIKGPLDLTVGLLRMLIFAATAGFAQLLGIGWKNKVLQLATALSFYSAVDLIVSLVQRHAGGSDALDPIRAVAFLLEIGFLVWAFTTKEVRRREFSPQMEQFLVTLAGRAKLARTALVRMQVK